MRPVRYGAEDDYGADYVSRQLNRELTEHEQVIANFLDWLFLGIYHIHGPSRRAKWEGDYVRVTLSTDLATYDGDLLTRMVVGAHDRAIRCSIRGAAPGYVYLEMWPRQRRGKFFERHPTLEKVAATMRRQTRLEDLLRVRNG